VASRVLGQLVGLLALLLGACAEPPPPRAALEDAELLPLLVVRHAWHTGVVVPAAALPVDSPFRAAFPEADWLELGWGDRLYYPHPDPPLWMALRAALWPTASAVNLTAHHGPAEAIPGEELFLLEVSTAGLARLHERALLALELDAGGRPIPIARGRAPQSVFWASPEPFHLLRTCNRWTAELLRAAGLPVVPFGTVTTGDLFRRIEPFARRLRRRRPATAARAGVPQRQRACGPPARREAERYARPREAGRPHFEAPEQEKDRECQHGAGSPSSNALLLREKGEEKVDDRGPARGRLDRPRAKPYARTGDGRAARTRWAGSGSWSSARASSARLVPSSCSATATG
jgi:hypothetical protein